MIKITDKDKKTLREIIGKTLKKINNHEDAEPKEGTASSIVSIV